MTFELTPPPDDLPPRHEPGSFGAWCEALNAAAKEQGCTGKPVTEQTGEEGWRHFFDAGYSPEDALFDDWINGS